MLPPWASTIARAIARPRPLPPRSRERLPSRRWKRSKICSSWSGGMPGPLSLTEISSRPSRARADDRDAVAGVGVGDGVADEVAEHLGESVGVGLERAVDGLELEVALAEQRQVAPEVLEELAQLDRARLDQLTCLGAGEREHVADEPVELVEAAQQRRRCLRAGCARRFRGRAARPGRAARERRAELVGGVRDEVALAFERPLEPLEHAVERVGQDPDLSAAADRARPHRQVAGVDGGGDPGHAPKRGGDQARQPDARGDREQQRERSDDQERPPEARLRLLHRGQRVGDAERARRAGCRSRSVWRAPACFRPRRRTRSPGRSASRAVRSSRACSVLALLRARAARRCCSPCGRRRPARRSAATLRGSAARR